MHKRKKALKYNIKPDMSGIFLRDNAYLDSGLEVLRELSTGYREIRAALKENSEEHGRNTEEHRINAEEHRKNTEEHRINAEEHRKNTEEHRINAEEHRKNTEEHRINAEEHRINTEEHRRNAEEHKKNSEEHERIFKQLNEHSGILQELRNDMSDMRKSLKETNKAVAALGNIIGYSLEDLTKIILPKWLKSEENIIVHNIVRKFTKLNDGSEIETNFVGKGTRNGRPIVVIGEAKTRTYRSEINTFQRYLQTIIPKYGGIEIYPFFVSYLYHDSAKAAARRYGIRLIESITLVRLTPSGLIMSSPDYNPCYP